MANDSDLGMAPLVWLDRGATSASPDAIKAEIAKLAYLRELSADRDVGRAKLGHRLTG